MLLKNSDFEPLGASAAPWVLRFSDFDAVGHMNNAAYWEMIEEHLAQHRGLRAPLRAVVEHVVQVEQGQSPVRHIAVDGDDLSLQVTVDGTVHAAMWCGVRA